MEKSRNSNFELLRIICIVLIIAYHYFVHGFAMEFTSITINNLFLIALNWGGKVACNIFILITGYFMVDSNIKYKKIIKLILEMFFYSYVILIFAIIFDNLELNSSNILRSFIPIFYGNWFLITYIQLYLLIPFINKIIHRLERRDNLKLILILILLFSIIPTFISSAYYVPNNICNFIIMYLIGAYIRKNNPKILNNKANNFISMAVSILLLIVIILILYVFGIYLNSNLLIEKITNITEMYSIFVIFCSISIFNFFRKINLQKNVINYFSSSVLGIYLIHDNYIIRDYIWNKIFPNYDYINSNTLIVHFLLKVLAIFLVCLIIDKLRIIVFEKFEDSLADKIYIFLKKYIIKIETKIVRKEVK